MGRRRCRARTTTGTASTSPIRKAGRTAPPARSGLGSSSTSASGLTTAYIVREDRASLGDRGLGPATPANGGLYGRSVVSTPRTGDYHVTLSNADRRAADRLGHRDPATAAYGGIDEMVPAGTRGPRRLPIKPWRRGNRARRPSRSRDSANLSLGNLANPRAVDCKSRRTRAASGGSSAAANPGCNRICRGRILS